MAKADWVTAEPLSGDGGSVVNVTVPMGESIPGGSLPRSSSFTVKTSSGASKVVSIQQKGFAFVQPLLVYCIRQSNPNYLFSFGYSTFPEEMQSVMRLCVKRFCVRFGGYGGTPQSGRPSFPYGSLTFFPPENLETDVKTIYHGDANPTQPFGDTSGDEALAIKQLNFVEYNFEEEVQDYTRTFGANIVITGEAKPDSLPCYVQFGHEAQEGESGDGNGLIWGSNVRVAPTD